MELTIWLKEEAKLLDIKDVKKLKQNNILCITDKSGLVVVWSQPVSGNHNDLFEIEQQITTMLAQLKAS